MSTIKQCVCLNFRRGQKEKRKKEEKDADVERKEKAAVIQAQQRTGTIQTKKYSNGHEIKIHTCARTAIVYYTCVVYANEAAYYFVGEDEGNVWKLAVAECGSCGRWSAHICFGEL